MHGTHFSCCLDDALKKKKNQLALTAVFISRLRLHSIRSVRPLL